MTTRNAYGEYVAAVGSWDFPSDLIECCVFIEKLKLIGTHETGESIGVTSINSCIKGYTKLYELSQEEYDNEVKKLKAQELKLVNSTPIARLFNKVTGVSLNSYINESKVPDFIKVLLQRLREEGVQALRENIQLSDYYSEEEIEEYNRSKFADRWEHYHEDVKKDNNTISEIDKLTRMLYD